MSDCFERLPVWAQSKFVVPTGQNDWERCYYCNTYKSLATLKVCPACNGSRIHPIYYCNAECQKADWSEHKIECRILRKARYEPLPPNTIRATNAKQDILRVCLALEELELINTHTVVWSMHCLYYYSLIDPSRVIFDVTIDLDSMQIISVSANLKENLRGVMKERLYSNDYKNLHGPGNQWYRINASVGGKLLGGVSFHRRDLPEGTMARKHDFTEVNPAWPWIAAHLTKARETSSCVARKKLELLVAAVNYQFTHTANFLDNYVIPMLKEDTVLTIREMNGWYKLLAPNRVDLWKPVLGNGTVERILGGKGYQLPQTNSS